MAIKLATARRKDTNRSLVRIFSVCLCSLVVLYCIVALLQLFTRETIDTADLAAASVHIVLGLVALIIIVYWPWLAGPLEHQIKLMGDIFETRYANLSVKTKIKL